MKIRLATKEDLKAIVEMGRVMAAESRFAPYGFNHAKSTQVVETMIGNPSMACMLVAVRADGEMVGVLAGYITEFFFCDAKVAQDRWFYVYKQHRGSPAAVKLLLAFRRWAENRGAHELNLNMSVAIDMGRFNRLMTRMGFSVVGSNFSLPLGVSGMENQVPAECEVAAVG